MELWTGFSFLEIGYENKNDISVPIKYTEMPTSHLTVSEEALCFMGTADMIR
jgi:hypothetical protein